MLAPGIVTTGHCNFRRTTMTLARAAKVIESGIERGLHLGAQLYVSQDGRRVADLAFGLAREGVAMTPRYDHAVDVIDQANHRARDRAGMGARENRARRPGREIHSRVRHPR